MVRGRRWQGRQYKLGRCPKEVRIGLPQRVMRFVPRPRAFSEGTTFLNPKELEVLRLTDIEDLSQEEVGTKMGISRGTVWRTLQSARKKVADALVNGKEIELVEELK